MHEMKKSSEKVPHSEAERFTGEAICACVTSCCVFQHPASLLHLLSSSSSSRLAHLFFRFPPSPPLPPPLTLPLLLCSL